MALCDDDDDDGDDVTEISVGGLNFGTWITDQLAKPNYTLR